MELYYIEHIDTSEVALEDDQFRHACKVMRKREGDEILLTDGKGMKSRGRIIRVAKRYAKVEIHASETTPPSDFAVHIALALTKNTKRIEWALEKMVEMGVKSVTPIICDHSERVKVNMDRLQKIAISAMKQSQQYHLPLLFPPVAFDDFCSKGVTDLNGLRYIAHLSEQSSSLRHNYREGNDVVIMIGPEGDFSELEIALARSQGFSPVTLGKTRLRTETAAVAAVAYIHALND